MGEQDEDLLKLISDTTVDQFDLPHRSVSNVTIVPSMQLSWHNVNAYALKGSQVVLNNVFGVANPGEVLAILGSSGAGKTTLLNVLTQRNLGELSVDGKVKVNGLSVTRDYMRKISAYVQQDDVFIGSLTVQEHLQFYAYLRMGNRYTKAQQKKRVKQVISNLGLSTVANSIIGTRTRKGLSGGEKKRLAFASEILTSPPILFCDEPTSGLDAFLAFQVISVLKRLAQRKGMTVLLTIHQPSSQVFELFDRVYFMAEGRVAFCGDHKEAYEFWNYLERPVPMNFNPSDHFISTLSETPQITKLEIEGICDKFARSEIGLKVLRESRSQEYRSRESSVSNRVGKHSDDGAKPQKYHANWFQQLKMLTWRNVKTTLREPTLLKVQLMQSIIIALLTGIFYLQNTVNQLQIMNINGSLFQMISNMAFMFQFSSIYNFCLEFPTFYREHGSNLYRISTYFLAKNIAEIPTYTLNAIIFASILYWMSGLVPLWDAFLVYVLAAVLVQNVAISIGYAMGCIFGSVPTASSVLPIFVTPMLAFGGFFINADSLPIFFYPFKYLSHILYGFEIITVNEWRHIDNIPGCSKSNTSIIKCLNTGKDVIDFMSFSEDRMWIDVIILCALVIGIRFLAFSGLYIRTKMKK